MSLIVVIASLVFLIFVAYRGYSVILFAPIAASLAVLLTDPAAIGPLYSSLFMEKMAEFVRLYFPVFMLGAIFGKVIELSGLSQSIAATTIRFFGKRNAILSVVLVTGVLTYGGVSLFVVVFAVYSFSAQLFRQCNIPKRLIAPTIALGAFTFPVDALPGTPQIQNIIPTTFFGTDAWAAPRLGLIGSAFILLIGLLYLNYRRAHAASAGEGYSTPDWPLLNEPVAAAPQEGHRSAFVALLPLVLVCVGNMLLTKWIPRVYGLSYSVRLTSGGAAISTAVAKVAAIWAVEAALVLGILLVFLIAGRTVIRHFTDGSKSAVSGALLASLNTATEYGYGAVIAALPGFSVVANSLKLIPDPLLREAVSITTLAGITGSAAGGLSVALGALGHTFVESATSAHIPMEVLHRVASMAAGGMDTLPHNGAVITLLAVTGLTHRQSYADIFAITCMKVLAVPFVIGVYYLTGIY
ncbi:MAG: GntP family permease [Paraburkholderia sp.]|uniref:GntP family permease n=2 Tax=Paraburkholderia sp. TaxID=1926495 RepID=UPI00397E3155